MTPELVMGWITAADAMDLLWRNALLAIPLALMVAAICRWLPCRPATRHALWCMALLSLLAPPIVPHWDWASWDSAVASNDAAARSSSADAPGRDDRRSAAPIQRGAENSAPQLIEQVLPKQTHSSLADRWLAYFNSFNPIISKELSVQPSSTPSPMELRTSARALNSPATAPLATSPVENFALENPRTPSTVEIAGSSKDINELPTACGDAGLPNPTPSETFSNDVSAASPQVFSNSSVPLASTSSSMQTALREWQVQLIAIRDALASLPPIPAGIWLGGSAVVIGMLLVRIVRFRRLINSSRSAPRQVQRFVKREAHKLRMSQAPAVYFTERRISPLIWCGRQRLMLLPRQLWNELDDIGRRAVVMHELAHLKRRDHWICWGDLIIGCLYWWHPIAWWVRRRIRDEADFCCDAWVTALLPAGRSAYARALLATRQFVGEGREQFRTQSAAVPVVGLGACTPKTKRFARRLTMVMTERSKPSMSILGAALAACLATAGWLAAPILACPPEESEGAHKAQLHAELKAKEKARAQTIVVAPMKKRSAEAERERELSTYEAYRADRDQPRTPHGDDDLRGRIDQLEHRLNRISEQLEHLVGGPHSMAPNQSGPGMRGGVGVTAPAAPGQQRRALAGVATLAPPPVPPAPPAPPAQAAPPAMARMRMAEMHAAAAMADSGEVEIRLYRLPAGKRDDFYKFMSRQDVPVLVSQAPEGVNVHATPHQHEFIKGFIDLIHPEGRQAPAAGGGQGGPRGGAMAPTEIDRLNKMAREYEVAAHEAVASGNIRHAQEAAHALRVNHQVIHDHMRQLHQRAGELRRKAIELQRHSEQLESKAESLNEAERFQIMTQAEVIAAEAVALEEQADAQDEQAEAIQEQIEDAQAQIEEVIAEAAAEAAEAADEAENEDSEESD